MKLHDQVALITGSATGIGRATALALAEEGAAVVVNYTRSEAEATETAAAIQALGGRCLLARADVSDDRQVRAMVEQTLSAFGRVDVLVNNAGYTSFVAFRDLEVLSDEIWDRTFAVNVKGTFYCSRAVAPTMLRQGSGCIVNVASDSGLKPEGSSIAYCAAKAGVISLTQTLAVALAPHVRVNAVAPGYTDTRWLAGRPGIEASVRANSLLERMARPEDIAEVIRSLVVGASMVTGQVIVVDGGQRPAPVPGMG